MSFQPSVPDWLRKEMEALGKPKSTSFTHRAFNTGNKILFLEVFRINTQDGHLHVYIWEAK